MKPTSRTPNWRRALVGAIALTLAASASGVVAGDIDLDALVERLRDAQPSVAATRSDEAPPDLLEPEAPDPFGAPGPTLQPEAEVPDQMAPPRHTGATLPASYEDVVARARVAVDPEADHTGKVLARTCAMVAEWRIPLDEAEARLCRRGSAQ